MTGSAIPLSVTGSAGLETLPRRLAVAEAEPAESVMIAGSGEASGRDQA